MSTKAMMETRKKNSSLPGIPSRSLLPQPRAAFPQRREGGPATELPARGTGHDFSQIPLYSSQAAMASCSLRTSGPRSCPFGGACHTCPSRVQAKLNISQPGDRYEQEADRVAEAVMRTSEPPVPASLSGTGAALQRSCSSCGGQSSKAEEDEDGTVQAKELPGQRADASDVVRLLRGSGQPLSGSSRAIMEPRFGHDFSTVRVHSDAEAAESARAMSARAYTTGNDIVFGAGQYAPATFEGQRLLAHELAHVVQQSSPGSASTTPLVQRQGGGPAALPEVKFDRFNAAAGGNTDPDNCCALCPTTLGVGRGGTGSNGMEMRFTVTGHRAGIEYDVTRTRRNSLWEQRAGVWSRLESDPMGTNDDHHDTDECLRPVNNHIFVIDTPGYPNTALPQPAGTIWGGLGGAAAHADATDVVFRFSFAEWAIARSRSEGIPWTVVSPGPYTYWRSTTWLHRNAAGQWVLDAGRSNISRGSISGTTINSAPVP